MTRALNLQADINQMEMEVEKNLPDQPDPGLIELESGRVGNFLLTSNFDL